MEEIISTNLEANGMSMDIINKCLEDIRLDCKETNYLHNSVADSNYYAAEKRNEDRRLEQKEQEHQKEIKRIQEEYEEYKWSARRRIARMEEEINALNNR